MPAILNHLRADNQDDSRLRTAVMLKVEKLLPRGETIPNIVAYTRRRVRKATKYLGALRGSLRRAFGEGEGWTS